MKKRAVVLLSGGLDSVTCLAMASSRGFECYALSFDYGQRSQAELKAAERCARHFQVAEHKVIKIGLDSLGGSALTDRAISVPEEEADGIPPTYVPARNTVFLAFGLGYAEVLAASYLFIGVNAVDYSGYPDCRPAFIDAFARMANLATKAAIEGAALHIETPLINMSKAQIIEAGHQLGLDYSLTVSCYQATDDGRACGICDSCRLRMQGFADAGLPDPTLYINS